MMSLSFLFGRGEPQALFQRYRNCVLTTITPHGHPQARKVRVAACSDDQTHLWFVVPKESGILADVSREPSVMLSVMDRHTQELVHVSGVASVVGRAHSPLYLAPGFCQAQALTVQCGEADVALLRVDLSERAGRDSAPPHRIFRILGHSSDMGARRGSQ
ncbi:pyridoxamine 5'-phosphate oxidase family protein [Sphaerotilaceae bacterium SBD11-9]